ncbi:hypothetical protein [Paracidovorax konjaci]|uniref:hypothetical protein n=1 Tax=Paracidovorax konjaci TaxID=32040 RepID=UPI0011134B89|nr:hypothetical protein [Paracidovorax konjaci]
MLALKCSRQLTWHLKTMNELQTAARLSDALERSGWGEWQLSRYANVKLSMVEQLLAGSRIASVGALCRVSSVLALDLMLHAAPPVVRQVGPVKTVVDEAIEKLNAAPKQENHIALQAQAFIESEYAELRLVHDFIVTLEFKELARRLAGRRTFDYGGPWLVEWLRQPDIGLGARPIALVTQPGARSLVTARLEQIILNAGA